MFFFFLPSLFRRAGSFLLFSNNQLVFEFYIIQNSSTFSRHFDRSSLLNPHPLMIFNFGCAFLGFL